MLFLKRVDLVISPTLVANYELSIYFSKRLVKIKKLQAFSREGHFDYLLFSKLNQSNEFFRQKFNEDLKILRQSGRHHEIIKNINPEEITSSS